MLKTQVRTLLDDAGMTYSYVKQAQGTVRVMFTGEVDKQEVQKLLNNLITGNTKNDYLVKWVSTQYTYLFITPELSRYTNAPGIVVY